MKIFHVHVKEIDNKVHIHFDSISEADKGDPYGAYNFDYVNFPNLKMDLYSKYGHHAKASLPDVVGKLNELDFYDNNLEKFKQSSINYQLPKSLPSAIYLIQELMGFINKNSLKATHFLMNGKGIQDDLQTIQVKKGEISGPPLPLMALFYPNDVEKARNTLVDIKKTNLAMQNYLTNTQFLKNQEVLVSHLLNEISNYCEKNERYQDIKKYLRLYRQGEQANTTKQDEDYAIQNRLLTLFSQELLNAGRKDELNIVLEALRLQTIRHLFSPAIGETAHDKGKYSWSYTEYQFLQHATFSLGQDGLMRIVDIQKNPAYKATYAKGEISLKEELVFLGQLIGLEFEKCSEFDKEIVLTKACTQQLLTKNLHLMTIDAIEKMSQPKNSPSFFKPQVLNNQTNAAANDDDANQEKQESLTFYPGSPH